MVDNLPVNSLRLIEPKFGSSLTGIVVELERLRSLRLSGDTPPAIFYQIKDIFHLLESIGSVYGGTVIQNPVGKLLKLKRALTGPF